MPTDPPAVTATIAAHRIEGWQPTAEHVEALVTLERGAVSFGDYLAAFRTRHPPPRRHRRRPGLRRPVPYFIPGTTLLRNHFGAATADMLTELEFIASAGRMVQWLGRPASSVQPDRFDVRVLHRQLFADTYSWAGEYRTTELRRGEQAFAWQSTIAERVTELHGAARSVAVVGTAYDDPRLAYELALLYAEFNQTHPFREGNGRTGYLLLHAIAESCGRRLDLTDVSRGAWYSAARDSMPARRAGRASHRPFLYLLGPALSAQ